MSDFPDRTPIPGLRSPHPPPLCQCPFWYMPRPHCSYFGDRFDERGSLINDGKLIMQLSPLELAGPSDRPAPLLPPRTRHPPHLFQSSTSPSSSAAQSYSRPVDLTPKSSPTPKHAVISSPTTILTLSTHSTNKAANNAFFIHTRRRTTLRAPTLTGVPGPRPSGTTSPQ